MRSISTFGLLGVLAAASCAPEPCTVADNGDGSYTLSCPDGTSASIGNGVDGENGAAWLVETAAEPAGANCADGGQAVSVGPDTNGDGQLGADEVASTTYVCDGADGADGVSYLVDVQDEAPGVNCENGGLAISVGPDADADGVLDDEEVTSVSYVCNGLNGPEGADALSPLVRVDDEPEGVNCEDGGLAVHTGIDDDEDGALSDPEIDTTDYICDGADGEDGAGGDAGFAIVDFPETDSTASNVSSTTTVGSSGLQMFQSGSYIEDTYTGTGVSSIEGLSYAFVVRDNTTTFCTVGTLTFDVEVNSTKVGTLSFVGGTNGTNITIADTLSFPAVAGTGTNGDDYTLRIEATNRVCSGAATYIIRPGGQFFLLP